jgi:adenylate cyclase class 2
VSADRPVEEVEVKLPCGDLDAVRRSLTAQGATRLAPLHEEVNDLYDDSERRLSSKGSALRLRQAAGRVLLTYKGPARFVSGVKVREERETEVSDPEAARSILTALGFAPTFRYEKRREEWLFEKCAVALDETPIGRFVEVEGEPTAIRRAVAALKLDFSEAIPYSYARLYLDRRNQDPALPPDMVFTGREAEGGRR